MTRRLDTAASARRVDLGARLPVAGQHAAAAARAAHRSAKPTLAFYGSAEWKALMRSHHTSKTNVAKLKRFATRGGGGQKSRCIGAREPRRVPVAQVFFARQII